MNSVQLQEREPTVLFEGAGLTARTCTSNHRMLANVHGRFCCSCWPGALNGGSPSTLGPWELQCGAVQPALARYCCRNSDLPLPSAKT